MQPKLIYFCHEPVGGLADYAHAQANALSALGVQVLFVTSPQFAAGRQPARYRLVPMLSNPPAKLKTTSRLVRGFRSARWILSNVTRLCALIRTENAHRVLLGAYFEYLAPFWAHKLRQCASNSTIFGAVVHDPVRGAVIGPQWWHRHSVASAYSFIREAFVHHAVELDTGHAVPNLRTTVIPHGPYYFPRASQPREAIRRRFDIPDDAPLLLAFGHLRNYKNLHLVLEAISERPEFYLLVAGAELRSGERSGQDYQELAKRLGVSERCRWEIRHIDEVEIGNFFEAADLILLTYSSEFRSASGVLNVAAHFQKPCLASSGSSNLRSVVVNYGLGYWVQPDSATEIARGLRRWLRQKPNPKWDIYAEENSWERNAELVIERLFGRLDERRASRQNPLTALYHCVSHPDLRTLNA